VAKDNGHVVTAISGKKEFTVFNIAKKGDYHKTNVLQRILTVFMQHDIDIEHIPSGIDSFSVIVASETVESIKLVLLKQLNELEGIESIDVEENFALIAVVGKNMAKTTGVAGTLFGALGNEKINVKVIAQSSTELSVIVGVDESDYRRAIQTIYYAFFK
jgi:aspartate kinase